MGRQGTGYEKLKLLELGSRRFGGIDAYIIRYNVGDSIPAHTDPVSGKKHFRLNVELKKATLGGRLCVKNPILRIGRLCLFRSDVSRHAVTRVNEGQRVVLSLGLAF